MQVSLMEIKQFSKTQMYKDILEIVKLRKEHLTATLISSMDDAEAMRRIQGGILVLEEMEDLGEVMTMARESQDKVKEIEKDGTY